MNVQEIIRKVQNYYEGKNLQLPDGDPLRHHYEIKDVVEPIRISLPVDGDAILKDTNEGMLLQDLVSNYSDKAAPTFEEIDERIGRYGMEAMAYYVPFHYQTPGHPWGIYLLDRGIWTVVNALEPLRNDGLVTNDLIDFSKYILFWHEFFHFLNEIAASMIEILGGLGSTNYHDYRKQVYGKMDHYDFRRFDRNREILNLTVTEHTIVGSALEEALANAYCYRQSKQIKKGIAGCLRLFMKNRQPIGYRNFDLFPWKNNLPTDRFRSGCSVLGSLLRDASPKNTETGSPYESLFDIYRKEVKVTDVPVYRLGLTEAELGRYGESARISLFKTTPGNEWHRSKNFLSEFRKLLRRSSKKIGQKFDESLQYASSENPLDRSRVGDERILCRKDNLRSFSVTSSIRAFYKTCKDDRQVLVGIQEHPERSDYPKIYKRDYCAELP